MKQTYLVKLYSHDNKQEQFYRHSEKRLSTVLKQEQRFWQQNKNDPFWKVQDDWNIAIYETPYEVTIENRVYFKTIKEFLEEQLWQVQIILEHILCEKLDMV